jgi:hypothetical protein
MLLAFFQPRARFPDGRSRLPPPLRCPRWPRRFGGGGGGADEESDEESDDESDDEPDDFDDSESDDTGSGAGAGGGVAISGTRLLRCFLRLTRVRPRRGTSLIVAGSMSSLTEAPSLVAPHP